jgi:hypothetical protein
VVAVSAPTPGPRPGPPTPGPRPGPPAAPGRPDASGTVASVQAAVATLDELDELPVGEHVARYDALHGRLSDALAAIDGV